MLTQYIDMVFICDQPYTETLSEFDNFSVTLSDFQKHAIHGILNDKHVLITAHTGSGKTLPAEFAIQHFIQNGKKVIYTSPIKALSNQKFYEFSLKYPHISFGLLTGDIKTNPTADVLIMTTEILMNYLFSMNSANKSVLDFEMDIENELGCVIFDEVHYINDPDRGQTWEQTILMLPSHVQMVLLSATIDNPKGFAEWIESRPNSKEVYLASTEHRVVPLTHYGFFATSEMPFKEIKDKTIQAKIRASTNKLILMRSAKGVFSESGYYELKGMSDLFNKYRFFMKRKFVLNKLVEYLRINEMLPAIVFVFSRKAVEQCASEITTNLLEDDSKIPYIMARECEQIVRKFPNYKEYLALPEYVALVKLLEKGIGIHHSGMMPVLREIVELMISKKYIKVLFATESFAIGLDCPIKTAVFSALRKFDGNGMRNLLPHEYTQMAGRAGRRGIDTVGHVVHCNNLFDIPTLQEYKDILCGKPQKLVSKFKISYPMVLNLLKHGNTNYDEFVDRSMLKKEIVGSIQGSQIMLVDIQNKYEKKQDAPMRTPVEICEEYIYMEDHMSMCKKRKEWERKMKDMKEEYKWLMEDVGKLREKEALKQSLVKVKEEVDYMQNYSNIHTNKIVKILCENGFITDANEFTPLGMISSNLHEIHPLLGSQLFQLLTVSQPTAKNVIVLFSLFTDLRVPEDQKRFGVTMENPFIKSAVNKLNAWSEDYATVELKSGTYTGIVYDELFQYDLMEEMAGWCDCNTEEECKYFIQTKLSNREISLGDFTKAILKICVITKEFISICEMVGNMDMLFIMKQIEPLICKYVATSQSLYV
jgi:superfamily II RNA helicase